VVEAADQPRLLDMMGQLRKDQHIEICRNKDVEASDRFTGFDRLHFIPEALPRMDESALDLSREFLGRTFSAPILITGMTGGISKGTEINRRLAQAAARMNIPMGVGSQRIALDNPEYAPIFKVKPEAPGLFLIGNIGMSQLTGPDALDICQRAVDMIDADALAIHFNLVQELVQVEGDRRFSGLLHGLERICKHLSVPVIAKEVGCGMAPDTVRRLKEMGFSAVDIGGKGGTSWSHIEGLRSRSAMSQDLGLGFRDWGIPTAYSLAVVHRAFPDLPLIATGGIRDGMTVAKAVALGARLVGIGLPLLRAALEGEEAPLEFLETLRQGLKVTLMATGAARLDDLSQRLVLGHPFEREFESIVRA
jgi:isopentenyl-diphosphate delta-isomerase